MRLKTFKIWLFLLPVVAVIGVLLFVQSTNNREELERQHIRSVATLARDIQSALSDYILRAEFYIHRKGFTYLPGSAGKNAQLVDEFLNGFQPAISNLKYRHPDSIPQETLFLTKNSVKIQDRKINFKPQIDSIFRQAVGKKPFVEGNSMNKVHLLTMDLEIPLRELMRKLETNDFTFQNFFLTNAKGYVIYPEESIGVKIFEPELPKTDSLGLLKAGILHQTILFDQELHQAYSQSLMLNQVKLHFVGLFKESFYQKVGLRINYNLLSTLLFILVLLICSIPILAVVNMGKGDILTQSRIIQVGISLMALAVLVGFSISVSKNRANPGEILQNEILTANKAINDTIAQYHKITDTVAKYHSLLAPWKEQLPSQKTHLTNELISIDSLGYVGQILFFKHSPDYSLLVNFEGGTSFSDLSYRNYFTYFQKKDHEKPFISSHYSRGSGQLESVISKKNTSLPESRVYAVTYSHLLENELSKNYRVLLVKQDGSLLFKSQKVESAFSNLRESINPDKWDEIQSLMKNNQDILSDSPLETNLYLNGHHYQAYFSPIKSHQFDQTLWTVFLVNTNVFHVFTALTSLEGVVLILAYFLILLFTLLILQLVRKNEDHQGFKAFLFDWLVPSQEKQGTLLFLILAYLGQSGLLVMILMTKELNHIQTFTLFTLSSQQVSFLNLILAKKEEIRSNRFPNELKINLIFSLIIALLIVFYDQELSIPMVFLLGYSLAISFLATKEVWWNKSGIFSIANKNHLTFYLLTWFFIIGFFPGYVIQSKTQRFETGVWNKSINPESEKIYSSHPYELARRELFSALSDPFDSKIQDFIAPDLKVIYSSWQGSKMQFTKRSIAVLLFLALLVISYFLIYWVQNAVFFEFRPHFPTVPKEIARHNFVCCINSDQIPDPIHPTKTTWVDFNYQTIPDFFPVRAKDYIFYNIHCLKDFIPLCQQISKIKDEGGSVTVYSGTLWKDLFLSLKSGIDRTIFSETFSDFRFMVIEIDEMDNQIAYTEDEMLSKMKRRKAFYSNVWTELSFEERQVCYGYAKEGFFNPAAKETLLDLAQKGIIISKSDPKNKKSWKEWRLFSPVFRQYILTNLSEDDHVQFKKFERKNGNITTIQTAIVSFVLICVALVGIFDKTFFNDAYVYLTGSLGLLGTLYSMLGQTLTGIWKPKQGS